MKIYTKKGDKGDTSLLYGDQVSKDNIAPEAYGSVDELVAALGLIRCEDKLPIEVKDTKPDKIKNEFEHSDFGEIEIKDIPRVKKLSSKYLINSWTTIPHVTNHDEADITEMESFRSSLTDMYTGEKIKITPLAFIIKGLVASLKKFPSFNSSIDEIETGKMTLKKYYHIGIAVDTPNGLMVPKLRNANNKKISLISKELKELSELC